MDYLENTIRGYTENTDKYISATSRTIHTPEFDTFLKYRLVSQLPVLDAGCAYGRDVEQLNQRGVETIGIDLTQAFIDQAKARYPQYTFQTMDVRHLDFPNESFSGIWCNAVLLHLKDYDIRQALTEFSRVLCPGGVVMVAFKEGSGSQTFVEGYSSNSERFYNFQSVEGVRNFLTKAGLIFKESYIYNASKENRGGPDRRDLNWIYAFAVKPLV